MLKARSLTLMVLVVVFALCGFVGCGGRGRGAARSAQSSAFRPQSAEERQQEIDHWLNGQQLDAHTQNQLSCLAERGTNFRVDDLGEGLRFDAPTPKDKDDVAECGGVKPPS
jgi:hypothetical protein